MLASDPRRDSQTVGEQRIASRISQYQHELANFARELCVRVKHYGTFAHHSAGVRLNYHSIDVV